MGACANGALWSGVLEVHIKACAATRVTCDERSPAALVSTERMAWSFFGVKDEDLASTIVAVGVGRRISTASRACLSGNKLLLLTGGKTTAPPVILFVASFSYVPFFIFDLPIIAVLVLTSLQHPTDSRKKGQ